MIKQSVIFKINGFVLICFELPGLSIYVTEEMVERRLNCYYLCLFKFLQKIMLK
jgi:hypothetical protein